MDIQRLAPTGVACAGSNVVFPTSVLYVSVPDRLYRLSTRDTRGLRLIRCGPLRPSLRRAPENS